MTFFSLQNLLLSIAGILLFIAIFGAIFVFLPLAISLEPSVLSAIFLFSAFAGLLPLQFRSPKGALSSTRNIALFGIEGAQFFFLIVLSLVAMCCALLQYQRMAWSLIILCVGSGFVFTLFFQVGLAYIAEVPDPRAVQAAIQWPSRLKRVSTLTDNVKLQTNLLSLANDIRFSANIPKRYALSHEIEADLVAIEKNLNDETLCLALICSVCQKVKLFGIS